MITVELLMSSIIPKSTKVKPILKIPRTIRFVVPTVLMKLPSEIEASTTAIEYTMKIIPTETPTTPFCSSSIGRKGAINEYALLDIRVHMQIQAMVLSFDSDMRNCTLNFC